MSVISNNTLAGSSGQGGAGYEIERSLRFNSADSPYLNRVFGTATSTTTFSISMWVKRVEFSQATYLFVAGTGTQGYFIFDPDIIRFYGVNGDLKTNAKYRDPSAWYHIVGVADTSNATSDDRMRLYVNGVRLTNANGDFSTHTQPAQGASLGDWNSAATHYVNRLSSGNYQNFYLADFHFIDGQALAASDFGETDLNGVWQPIEYAGTYGTNGFKLDFSDTSSNAALGTDTSGNSNTWTVNNLTASSGIGPGITSTVPENLTGNWTGIIGIVPSGTSGAVAVFPDGGGTAQSRGTFYWTGLTIGDTITWYGTTGGTDNRGVTGNVDETSITAPGSSLGTIQLTVNAASGSAKIDFSGTANCYGITPGPVSTEYNDFLRDSPSQIADQTDTGVGGEVVGNYCTWNPLGELTGGYVRTLTDGNLTAGGNGDSIGTITFGSGKTYFELTVTSASGFSQGYYGIVDTKQGGNRTWAASSIAAFRDTGSLYGTSSTGSAAAAAAVGTIYGIAVDVDNQKMFISVNGTWLNSGNPASGTGASFTGRDFSDYAPLASLSSSNAQTITLNTGQRTFNTAAPSGYKALCTANLSDPTIADGSTAFDAKLWTGNGGAQTITGYGFSPDLAWIKSRSEGRDNVLFDTVRGAQKYLVSNSSSAEVNSGSTLIAFNSDGFNLNGQSRTNVGSQTYVGWAWDGGSSNTTIAVGGENSSAYEMSAVWSNYGDNTHINSSYPWSKAFDGVATGDYQNGATAVDNQWARWTPTGGLTISSSLRINTDNGSTSAIKVKFTGQTVQHLTSLSDGWNSVSGTGTLEYIEVYNTGGTWSYLCAVEADNKLVIDSGVTPPVNVPTIASTVRANPSAGFSIVSYTGSSSAATVGHGLNAAPGMIIVKDRDSGSWNWQVAHSGIGADDSLLLNDSSATADYNAWNNTRPTSSVFSLGGGISGVSTNGNAHIAYCFAPVEGYSSMGTYLGNGSANGPFVFTGMRPAFILTKGVDDAEDWYIRDAARSPHNEVDESLRPNDSGSEYSGRTIDILSNGFKITDSDSQINESGKTYLYYAVAEHPFKTSRAR